MKQSSRLFYCLRCTVQVVICSHCDRGQIYCGSDCSKAARLQSVHAAEKRYQNTSRGKMNHALRQRRYRAHIKEKVTDQGSRLQQRNALLASVENETEKENAGHKALSLSCFCCQNPVSSWLRNGFLRQTERIFSPVLSTLCRPP